MKTLKIGDSGSYPFDRHGEWEYLTRIPEDAVWAWLHSVFPNVEMTGEGWLRFKRYPGGAEETFCRKDSLDHTDGDWRLSQRMFPNKEYVVVGKDREFGHPIALYNHDHNIHDYMMWIIINKNARLER